MAVFLMRINGMFFCKNMTIFLFLKRINFLVAKMSISLNIFFFKYFNAANLNTNFKINYYQLKKNLF